MEAASCCRCQYCRRCCCRLPTKNSGVGHNVNTYLKKTSSYAWSAFVQVLACIKIQCIKSFDALVLNSITRLSERGIDGRTDERTSPYFDGVEDRNIRTLIYRDRKGITRTHLNQYWTTIVVNLCQASVAAVNLHLVGTSLASLNNVMMV